MAAAYLETGLLSDLQRTIRLAEEAVEATPADHPHSARHIAQLAAYLTEFYRRMGTRKGIADLGGEDGGEAGGMCE